jgi:hypothetical protein
MSVIDSVVLTTGSAVPAEVSTHLTGLLGVARAERWLVGRSHYEPTLRIAWRDGAPVAAILTSARPATAATKIVDAWWAADHEAEARALLAAVVDAALQRADAAVKWEIGAGLALPEFAVTTGFVPMKRPWSAKGTEALGGAVLWLEDIPHEETGYYAQTTMYTCGAVAALIGMDARGYEGLAGIQADRRLELSFWRAAANFPACEPIGLAVAVKEALASAEAAVDVFSDVDGPVLLEGFDGFEYEFRAELQRESIAHAGEIGVGVSRDTIQVAEIATRIAAGAIALLLIDEEPMHGEAGPHWIVAHATAGDLVLVEDPWVGTEDGETWVDTHDLPIRLDQIDRLVAWGQERLRGVVFL